MIGADDEIAFDHGEEPYLFSLGDLISTYSMKICLDSAGEWLILPIPLNLETNQRHNRMV